MHAKQSLPAQAALNEFWRLPAADVLRRLEADPAGLSSQQAQQRLKVHGPNLVAPPARRTVFRLLLAQFRSPIMLILIFAAGLSFFLENSTDALIILAIVLISGLLGFFQEKGASDTVASLLSLIKVSAAVLRDGHEQDLPAEAIVPGDIVQLQPGKHIPGDGLLLQANDLYVDESTLTGETFPVAKNPGDLTADQPGRGNAIFAGTHVFSGSGLLLIVKTGAQTEFGQLARDLRLKPPETEFERGVRQFGYLLMEVTIVLVLVIFGINVYLHHPLIDALLFSVALAVGLTPQLLPAIISINLAHGAKQMSRRQVIVKRLEAIENFGSMNILCSDKTGTLTEGVVKLYSARNATGSEDDKILFLAYLNACHHKGFANPLDQAIKTFRSFDVSAWPRLDEIPYDFIRKRLSVLVAGPEGNLLVCKGAFEEVLSLCTQVEIQGESQPISNQEAGLRQQFEAFSREGLRVLGLACRQMGSQQKLEHADESGLSFLGFLLFFDPPKAGIAEAIAHLRNLGVDFKLITGDNHLVARSLAAQIGLAEVRILRGSELKQLSDGALFQRVTGIDIFSEIEPNQKERIVLALKKRGHIVGYLGDGINDVTALHTADVSISVEGAVDVAKESADIVLMEKDLEVLCEGVRQGRITFANTLKYVFMATSANFGNMFSMAGASLFVSFLPLLPKQILLTNLLTDIPELTIATDHVDPELLKRPRRWNIPFIRRFMLVFGILSSVFDYTTFGVLLYLLGASMTEFRTGWFVESVISAALIVMVIRTEKPFLRSRPGKYLSLATTGVILATLALPWTPLAPLLGFAPLPPLFLLVLGLILGAYVLMAEAAKALFYRRFKA
ncbi:MAG: magnesium-translocating P-type ATPase [Candidatus Sericytochromatia bacterium]